MVRRDRSATTPIEQQVHKHSHPLITLTRYLRATMHQSSPLINTRLNVFGKDAISWRLLCIMLSSFLYYGVNNPNADKQRVRSNDDDCKTTLCVKSPKALAGAFRSALRRNFAPFDRSNGRQHFPAVDRGNARPGFILLASLRVPGTGGFKTLLRKPKIAGATAGRRLDNLAPKLGRTAHPRAPTGSCSLRLTFVMFISQVYPV